MYLILAPMMMIFVIIVAAFLIGYGCRAVGLTVTRNDTKK